MKVKILILRGETGILLPGRLVDIPDQQAKEWIAKGWATENKCSPEIKEDKTVIETKQEKFTKKHKNTK